MKDFLGNEIKVGDNIIFPKRCETKDILGRSVVNKIENNIIWFKYNDYLEVGYEAKDVLVIKM